MEKIYIEENQRKQKNYRLSVSVGMSFAVAFIAIVSILFISLSGTTYSSPDVATLPKTITTLQPTAKLVPTAPTAAYSIGLFTVEPYSAQGISTPVYCVESAVNYRTATLNRVTSPIDDEGFIYLLTKIETMNIDMNKVAFSGNDVNGSALTADAAKKYLKSWIGQTAIWMYLGSTGAPNSKTTYGDSANTQVYVAANRNDLYNINTLKIRNMTQDEFGTIGVSTSGLSFYKDTGMNEIVNAAISYHGQEDVLTVGLSKASDKFVTSGKYLKSDKITVRLGATGNISDVSDTYAIKLSNAPAGSKVYGINKSGKEEEIKDLSKVSFNTYNQFYVYIPFKKVDKKETINFTVEITGNFEVYTGYYYETSEVPAQRVTTVDKVSVAKNKGVSFSVALAPDTGVDASSIMYIVGMVVLLSGLGILYVNIKNQKQYQ